MVLVSATPAKRRKCCSLRRDVLRVPESSSSSFCQLNFRRWVRLGMMQVVFLVALLLFLSVSRNVLLNDNDVLSPRFEGMPSHAGPVQHHKADISNLGELKCEKHGGPSVEAAREMIYWKDIPKDRNYQGSYRSKDKRNNNKKKYLSVEVDAGGWNNIRMTVEIGMAMAHATGRTFIVPPRQGMYLLNKTYSLHDFYDLEGLDVMEMQDFLEQEILTGNIRDPKGQRVFPPSNRTNWDVITKKKKMKELDYFMRTISKSPKTRPIERVMFIPKKPTPAKELERWEEIKVNLGGYRDEMSRSGLKHFNNPTPVDAAAEERFEEFFQDRDLWLYDEELHHERVIHFMAEDELNIRIHGNYYHALFFEDWKMDLVVKRYVRDRLRYRDELFCAAARVVETLRNISLKDGNGGKFYAYHVRRGDFAWKDLVKNAHEIYWSSHEQVPLNATVYIATDEMDKTWFNPLKERFQVYFLDDFMHLIDGFNSNYYGVLDQIIATRGNVFFGPYYSSMTMNIIQMRGHYSQVEKLPGWELGVLDSYYYAPKEHKEFFRYYHPFGRAGPYDTAFPIAWRDIDKGM